MAATLTHSAVSCSAAVSSSGSYARQSEVVRSVRASAFRNSFCGPSLKLSKQMKARSVCPLVKASSEEVPSTTSVDTEKIVADLKEKWDKIENKPAVALYTGGAVVVVWLSSAVVGAISAVPLLPKLLELVGVGYTGWFVYRYLLFKSSRKELAMELEELKNKVTGATGLDDK